jgi:hypothetical protein
MSSTFPGIGMGDIATWYNNMWTVNGVTTPGGVQFGCYNEFPGGFTWSNGSSSVMWQKIA